MTGPSPTLCRAICGQDSRDGLTWFEVVGPPKPPPETQEAQVFEFGWTLGYQLDTAQSANSLLRYPFNRASKSRHAASLHVQIFLPTWSDWLSIMQAATLRHLSPVREEEQWRRKLAKDWRDVSPIVEAAGQVTADVTGLAPIAAVAKAAAGLHATSIPQTADGNWYVDSLDLVEDRVLYQGIEWTLSRNLLEQVGSRIGGRLLVSFARTTTDEYDNQHPLTAPESSHSSILASATLKDESGVVISNLPRGGERLTKRLQRSCGTSKS